MNFCEKNVRIAEEELWDTNLKFLENIVRNSNGGISFSMFHFKIEQEMNIMAKEN